MKLNFNNEPDPRFPRPPNEIGVPNLYVPNTDYVLLVEKISATKGDFVPLDPRDNPIYQGRDADKYVLPLYLVRQNFTPDGSWCFRYWSSDRNYSEQDTWNYSLQYAGENTSFPIYARNYLVARKDYVPLARKSRLNSLLNIRLTNGGSGYTSPPIVTLTGTNATAVATIGSDGKVNNIYLTSLGTNYTPPIGVGFSGGEGTGAAASAVVQPVNAVLIKERMEELSLDNPLHGRYVQVNCFYSTIPGPWFKFAKKEDDGSITHISRRQNWTDEITPGSSYNSSTLKYTSVTYEPAEETDFVSWEIHSEYSIPNPEGEGEGGTDPLPEFLTGWLVKETTDRDGIIITEKRRLNVVENIVPGFKIFEDDGNKIWMQTNIEPKAGEQDLVWEVITYRIIPGADIFETKIEEDGKIVKIKRKLNWTDDITPSETYDSEGLELTVVTYEPTPESYLVSWEVTTVYPIPDPDEEGAGGTDPVPEFLTGWLVKETTDRDGLILTEKRRLNVVENIEAGFKIFEDDDENKIWVQTSVEAKGNSEKLVWEVITYRYLIGPQITGVEYDSKLNAPTPYRENFDGKAPSNPLAVPPGTTYEIINSERTIKRVRIPNTDAYNSYSLGPIPSTASIFLPDELLSVAVVWVKDKAEGTSASDFSGTSSGTKASLSGSESASVHSSGSLIPDLQFRYKRYSNQRLRTEVYFCYLPIAQATITNILAKYSAQLWPIFKLESHSITLKGGKISVQANTSASGHYSFTGSTSTTTATEGEGTSYDFNAYLRTIDIAPCIHGSISLSGTTSDTLEVDAESFSGWTGTGGFPTLDVNSSASKELSGSVTPTSLSATSPSSVPTSGRYLIDTNVQPADDGYVYVMVELFNAAQLA